MPHESVGPRRRRNRLRIGGTAVEYLSRRLIELQRPPVEVGPRYRKMGRHDFRGLDEPLFFRVFFQRTRVIGGKYFDNTPAGLGGGLGGFRKCHRFPSLGGRVGSPRGHGPPHPARFSRLGSRQLYHREWPSPGVYKWRRVRTNRVPLPFGKRAPSSI